MWLQSRYLKNLKQELVLIIIGIILLQTPNASGSDRYVRQVTCDRFSECVAFRQCIFWRKKFGSIPPNEHLSKLREINCAQFNTRDPMVCCPRDLSVRTKPLTPNSVVRQTFPTNCGHVTVTDRIIGGTFASIGDYPWMAAMGYGPADERRFECGGALISTRFVLTVAHCAEFQKIEIVRLGEVNLETSPDCIHNAFGPGFCAPKEQDYRVEKVITHENYKKREQYSDDIALIKLEKPVTFSAYIFPICMPEQNADIEAQVTLKGKTLVVGWGTTKEGVNILSPKLKKVNLPFVNKNACKARFAKFNDYKILDEQICFGGFKGKDSCTGDSGSPLMHPKQGAGPPYDLIGLVSFGVGCGREIPGIYTNVKSYRQWIVDNMIL